MTGTGEYNPTLIMQIIIKWRFLLIRNLGTGEREHRERDYLCTTLYYRFSESAKEVLLPLEGPQVTNSSVTNCIRDLVSGESKKKPPMYINRKEQEA